MAWLLLLFLMLSTSFFQVKLWIFTLVTLIYIVLFNYFGFFSTIEIVVIATPLLLVLALLNNKKLRIRFITKPLYNYFCNSETNWQLFKRIDDGWFASDFERLIFQGKPHFISFTAFNINNHEKVLIEEKIYDLLLGDKQPSDITKINKLAKLGATSFAVDKIYKGQSLNAKEISGSLKNISKVSPVVAAILGLLNLDSLISVIHHFGSRMQKEKYLPLFSNAKMMPFLKPTSLFETLDSQKSSIEGRVEKEFVNGKEIVGVRITFQDIILLGTSQSNCFYLNVNIKDFNNYYSDITHLGTAIFIINNDIKGITYRKGLKAYDGHLNYYAGTGNNVFIPFSHIINETNGIGKGMEYLYRNQCIASSIWPLAISIPTNKTATLTAWYFAHLQKQNGRQLLSFKIVLAKLNEQFSQCLKLQLTDNLALHNNLNPELLKFTAILNKETHIAQTIEQLGLLRSILGSNAHNIKTESNVRSFYKVAHLATELDGMSHEINQLPLMKKAALACHPFYNKEVDLLMHKNTESITKFDNLIIKHIAYIFHNLVKTWAYSIRTSGIARIFFPKNKYKYMIKRMSSSFAFLSDIALINWTFKSKINTSFASYLAQCIQQITSSVVIYDYYITLSKENNTRELTKLTLKNTLYLSQQALKETINLAFDKIPAIFMKLLLFPFGRPFHQIKMLKPLQDDIEDICSLRENPNSPYSKYSPFLKKIYLAKQKLKNAESAEIAVTNATGTPLNTDNYQVLINRCLAAGIVSVEQSENLREAYECILEIKLTNHFGNTT